MWAAIGLSAALVVYNNLINRWRPFHGAAYVPVNVAFTACAAALVMTLDVTALEIGIVAEAGEIVLPLALVALFGLGAFALAISPRGRSIADARVAGMQGGELAWYVLIRIPIGTAVVEETLFRGILFAVWAEAGSSDLLAALGASIAFGLWHIAPTAIGLRMNDPHASKSKVCAVVLGAVVLTTIAGLLLTWLRVRSGSLWGPIVLHAGVNSMGALAAVVAGRRTA